MDSSVVDVRVIAKLKFVPPGLTFPTDEDSCEHIYLPREPNELLKKAETSAKELVARVPEGEPTGFHTSFYAHDDAERTLMNSFVDEFKKALGNECAKRNIRFSRRDSVLVFIPNKTNAWCLTSEE